MGETGRLAKLSLNNTRVRIERIGDLPRHDVENFSLHRENRGHSVAQKETQHSLKEIKGAFDEK